MENSKRKYLQEIRKYLLYFLNVRSSACANKTEIKTKIPFHEKKKKQLVCFSAFSFESKGKELVNGSIKKFLKFTSFYESILWDSTFN